MSLTSSHSTLLAAAALLLSLASAHAAVIARFDAGDTTATEIQSTFTAIGAAGNTPAAYAGPQTAISGAVTLRLTAGTTLAAAITKDGSGDFNSTASLVTRDRTVPGADTGTFTYSDIYRDFVTGNALGIQLSGLTPSSPYAITFYSYDNSGSRTQTFSDITPGSGGLSGTVVYTAASIFNSTTSNEIFSATVTATSDSAGRLFFSGTGVGSGSSTSVGILNGLVVDAIPEPSAVTLAGLAVFSLARRRRCA